MSDIDQFDFYFSRADLFNVIFIDCKIKLNIVFIQFAFS